MSTDFKTFILLHSSNCGWCKQYKPHWNSAKNKYTTINFYDYDFDNEEIKNKYFEEHKNGPHPTGYPTIVVINNNNDYKVVMGANDPDRVKNGDDIIPVIKSILENQRGGGLFDWFCGNDSKKEETGVSNNLVQYDDERIYKEKYLKYKNKYLNLKKNNK